MMISHIYVSNYICLTFPTESEQIVCICYCQTTEIISQVSFYPIIVLIVHHCFDRIRSTAFFQQPSISKFLLKKQCDWLPQWKAIKNMMGKEWPSIFVSVERNGPVFLSPRCSFLQIIFATPLILCIFIRKISFPEITLSISFPLITLETI